MLPLLRLISSRSLLVREASDILAKEFSLPDQERSAVLPSGKQSILTNRVHWADYLVKAGQVPG